MKRIMFVCRHNSRRSQMAEGFARNLGGAAIEAVSAGLEPGSVDPLTVQAMAEVGIDISQQTSQARHADRVAQLRHGERVAAGEDRGRPGADDLFLDD